MPIQTNVSLADHSTMGLGGNAAYFMEAHTRMEVLEALSWAQTQNIAVCMIGRGSNIVWKDSGFAGLVIANRIERYEVFTEDETNTYLTIGSGENWDSVVRRSVEANLSGIEALSLIPGAAGAVPIQNVGAYGQEIAQTLVSIEAFDTQVKDFVTLPASDCEFGYRTSRFKLKDRGRFYITALTLHLTTNPMQPPFYPELAGYIEEHGLTAITPAVIREAVIDIRSHKLPDPAVVKNCGSFFANPIIPTGIIVQLETDNDASIPNWPVSEGYVKISAAWLIGQAGFNDYHDPQTGMGTWRTQSLVMVNEHATSTASLLAFKEKIVNAVKEKFNITLVQEPELLP
jgi:UDP-N-acetylmuramate dehydrogenase